MYRERKPNSPERKSIFFSEGPRKGTLADMATCSERGRDWNPNENKNFCQEKKEISLTQPAILTRLVSRSYTRRKILIN